MTALTGADLDRLEAKGSDHDPHRSVIVSQMELVALVAIARRARRMEEALRDCVNALSATPAFNYASRDTPMQNSKQVAAKAYAILSEPGA